MRYLPILALLGVASATGVLKTGQRHALLALKGVMERQLEFCQPVREPATCERSCGPGYVTCIRFPTCYNPGAGDSCCSDGTYCPAGYYCTNAGCCPIGTPLAQCGATVSLSVIPPPGTAPTTAPPPPPGSTSTKTTAATTKPTVTPTTTRPPAVTAGAAQLGANILAGLGGLGAAWAIL